MDVPDELYTAIKEKAEQIRMPISINQPIYKTLPPINRCVAIFQPFFLDTGDVITCCAQHEHNAREWERSMKMGNIFETRDFKKIWYGNRYRHLRETLHLNKTPEYCIDCPIHNWKAHEIVKAIPCEC